MKFHSLFFFWLLLPFLLNSQEYHDLRQSVILTAETNDSSNSITLYWVLDDEATGYIIYRKSPVDLIWGIPKANLGADVATWTDHLVQEGVIYEYRVEKTLAGPNSNGYIYSGWAIPPIHQSGVTILVIDSSFKHSLEFEIRRLVEDLENEGWRVRTLYCSEDDTPAMVRNAIIDIYNDYPDESLYTAFLLGRVPVPYSGNIVPDGHPDHQGAWPADGYYGTVSGNWTDQSVNNTVANDPRNHNIPGDGKFDQSVFPAQLRLAVGRVDFSRLPALGISEEDMIRNYLDKNHLWRTGKIPTVERGLVQNNFGGINEGFGQNGYKNFSTMFGADSVHALPYRSTLQNEAYLWSYGAGPGNPSGAGGIISTNNLSVDSLQSIFTMIFGSYFGDWGYNNNLLRAAIATGTTLTNVWAGRPNWQFHHMAMGKPIGYSTLKSKNNSVIYQSGFFARGVHMALIGDPTLLMYPGPKADYFLAEQDGTTINFHWNAVQNAEGYFIYQRAEGEEIFSLLNEEIQQDTFFQVECPYPGIVEYLLRTVELRQTASGNFYNSGTAFRINYTADLDEYLPESNFNAEIFYDLLTVNNLSSNATAYIWNFGDDISDTTTSTQYLYPIGGIYDVCLIASNRCYESQHCEEIEVINSMPEVDAEILPIICFGEENGSIMLILDGGSENPEFLWNTGETENQLNGLAVGSYSVSITSITGKSEAFGPYIIQQPDSISAELIAQPPIAGENNGGLEVVISGGTEPYKLLWSNGDSSRYIGNLAAGNYCLTITDSNLCIKELCYTLETASNTSLIEFEKSLTIYPNPTADWLKVEWKQTGIVVDHIELLDAGGKVLEKINISSGQTQIDLSLSKYPSAIYFIRLEFGKNEMIYSINKK